MTAPGEPTRPGWAPAVTLGVIALLVIGATVLPRGVSDPPSSLARFLPPEPNHRPVAGLAGGDAEVRQAMVPAEDALGWLTTATGAPVAPEAPELLQATLVFDAVATVAGRPEVSWQSVTLSPGPDRLSLLSAVSVGSAVRYDPPCRR